MYLFDKHIFEFYFVRIKLFKNVQFLTLGVFVTGHILKTNPSSVCDCSKG